MIPWPAMRQTAQDSSSLTQSSGDNDALIDGVITTHDTMHYESPWITDSEFVRASKLLYISHFLSTWNSRLFEFGSYLFLAKIFPDTLLPSSIYALSRAGSAAVMSPWLGQFVDNGNRLNVVRVSIVGQRFAVAASCALLSATAYFSFLRNNRTSVGITLSALSALAVVEKLSSVLNTIAIERDWVVRISCGNERWLQRLNSQMRRIDLFCKLVGPLAISLIDTASSQSAIISTGALSAVSVAVEYFAIARVYATVPELRVPQAHVTSGINNASVIPNTTFKWILFLCKNAMGYFRHPVFLPSFALSLLYLTVLSFSGQMVTYLLALGMSSGIIGVLRGVAAIFELSATCMAPKVMNYVGPIRAGIWFINWQIFCVSIACLFFWIDQNATVVAMGTVLAVIASRVGLWGFDLSVQIIVQEEVEADLRGTFSSQEFAFQNIFEMLSFLSTIIFAQPSQFKIPATISAGAVASAGVLYATFVRMRRGHLVHLSSCMERNHSKKQGIWSRVSQDEEAEGMDVPAT